MIMTLARIFLYLSLAMLAGIGLASLVEVGRILILAAVAIAVFLLIGGILVKKHSMMVAGILLAGFVLGFWRFDSVWFAAQNNKLVSQNGKVAEITGIVVNDPVSGAASRQLIINPDGLDGKILVLSRPYPEYQYGDRIKFTAALEAPQGFDGFDYKNYLAKDGIYSMVRYPEIELVSTDNGNIFYTGIFWVKHKLMIGISQSLPSPQNSLLIAILFGDQSGLDGCSAKELEIDPGCTKLKEELNISGLRHLAAVSGTHVTIMAGIIAPFLIWLGWWRQKALWATLIFIWVFILMIGLPASAVRAGIMGSLMIIAQIAGRPASILRLMAVAAVFMAWQNPLILRFDIGFELSFLAVLGMACFANPIEQKLKVILSKPEFLTKGLAVTLAAQITTLPLLIYSFGYISPYAPVSNILVEPFVEFITIYGFIFALVAAVNLVLGWLLFFPVWLALSYLIKVAQIFSSLPFSKLDLKLGLLSLAISYAVILIIVFRIRKKEKLSFLR